MKLYLALYNPMIHESTYCTLSIHKTREGAEKAIAFHKKEMYEKCIKQEKNYYTQNQPEKNYVPPTFEDWDKDFQDWIINISELNE